MAKELTYVKFRDRPGVRVFPEAGGWAVSKYRKKKP